MFFISFYFYTRKSLFYSNNLVENYPYPILLINESTIKYQPSTKINSNTLIGSEII